jgi:hypothetical protein
LDITRESEAEETRARYLVEREERATAGAVAHGVEGEEGIETTEAPEIDPELVRKLEEFKRTMLEQWGGEPS